MPKALNCSIHDLNTSPKYRTYAVLLHPYNLNSHNSTVMEIHMDRRLCSSQVLARMHMDRISWEGS